MVDTAAIETFRKKKGISQKDFAKSINNLTQSGYSNKISKNNFTDDEIKIICKLLSIKKEQITLNDLTVNDMTLLVNKAVQNESALKVILSTLAEILAKLTDGNATKIRTDLESVVDSQSRQALERLGHRV